MTVIIKILQLLFALSILILVHEFGRIFYLLKFLKSKLKNFIFFLIINLVY